MTYYRINNKDGYITIEYYQKCYLSNIIKFEINSNKIIKNINYYYKRNLNNFKNIVLLNWEIIITDLEGNVYIFESINNEFYNWIESIYNSKKKYSNISDIGNPITTLSILPDSLKELRKDN